MSADATRTVANPPPSASITGGPLPEAFPSVLHMLADTAIREPAREALRCGDKSLDYAGYAGAVARLAERLRDLGIGPGDRVATLMGNSLDAVVATFGVQAAGAQLVPLNPAYTVAELCPILADAEPSAIVYDVELNERVRAATGVERQGALITVGLTAERLTSNEGGAARWKRDTCRGPTPRPRCNTRAEPPGSRRAWS